MYEEHLGIPEGHWNTMRQQVVTPATLVKFIIPNSGTGASKWDL